MKLVYSDEKEYHIGVGKGDVGRYVILTTGFIPNCSGCL